MVLGISVGRLRLPPVVPPVRCARFPLLVIGLIAAASVSWQLKAAAAPPLERLQAGRAYVAMPSSLRLQDGSVGVTFSPDSRALWACYSEEVVAWRLRDDPAPWSPVDKLRPDLAASISVAALAQGKTLFSPDGRYRLVGRNQDRRLYPSEIAHGIECHDEATHRLVLTTDVNLSCDCGFDERSRRLVVVNSDRWETEAYALPDGKHSVRPTWGTHAVSPDGRLVAGIEKGCIVLRDRKGHELARFWFQTYGQWLTIADGRYNGATSTLEIVDGDRHLPVLSDSPLVDPSLFPRIR